MSAREASHCQYSVISWSFRQIFNSRLAHLNHSGWYFVINVDLLFVQAAQQYFNKRKKGSTNFQHMWLLFGLFFVNKKKLLPKLLNSSLTLLL
jgi:hypothetical protein